ncbi:unnamed protein product [Musa textilis]
MVKDKTGRSICSDSGSAPLNVDRGAAWTGAGLGFGGSDIMLRKGATQKVAVEAKNKVVLRSHAVPQKANPVVESKTDTKPQSTPTTSVPANRNGISSGVASGVGRAKEKEKVAVGEKNKTILTPKTGKGKERSMIADEKGVMKRKIGGEQDHSRVPARKPRTNPVIIDATRPEKEEKGYDEFADDEFHCSICMETKQLNESFGVSSCSHIFCTSCIGQYIAAKVEENMAVISCPDPGCKDGILEPDMCKLILPEDVFHRWGIALCESALGTQKFYCPFKECSALLVYDGAGGDKQLITNSECPHCHRMFCAQCMVPWHAGICCEGFQELGKDERTREDILMRKLATDSKWQRCPQCRIYVEKIDGCMFMTCRCGYCFCYVCASPMTKELHYCAKCQR